MLFVAGFAASLFFAPGVAADNADIGGFAWSENIGWVSFNNNSVDGIAGGGGSNDYGLTINGSGLITGYAWSENIGEISFNRKDTEGCGGCSGTNCDADADMAAAADGKHWITGWARAIAACKDSLWNDVQKECTGGGAGDKAGGWDGCIKLGKTATYGVYIDENTGDLHGWATGSADSGNGVIGWLSFNRKNCDTNANGVIDAADAAPVGCPAIGQPVSAYRVHSGVKFPPEAKMECGGDCPGGICAEPTWVAYPPVGCPACVFEFRNKSKGDVRCAYWELTGPATYSYSAPMPLMTINLSAFGSNLVPGDYELRLTVSNDSSVANCSAGVADSVTHPVHIKQEVVADFECAFDNTASTIWQDCTSAAGKVDFAKKMVKGGKVYVRGDNSSGSHYSVPSEDATAITDYNWTFTIDGAVLTATGDIASFVAGKNNKINLIAEDNSSTTAGGRNGCITVDLGARSLPKWQEISPVGMIWNHIVAGIAKIFATI